MDDLLDAAENKENNKDEGNNNNNLAGKSVIKIFPNSKFYGAMGKIWPGHTVPRDFVDDAIDVIVIDYRDDKRKKFDDKAKIQEKEDMDKEEQEFEQQQQQHQTMAASTMNASFMGGVGGDGATGGGGEIKSGDKKKSFVEPAPPLPEDFSKDGLTKDEFTLAFRIIANLSNWRTILPVGAPKLLGIEDFALAAERLKRDKVAKMFMEVAD